MASTLTTRPEAEQDVDSAVAWYESRRAGLGDQFLRAVRACVANILGAPKAYPVLQGPYRHAPVPGFPYIIIYRYDEPSDVVIVYYVFHTSQDPSKLRQRLP